MNGFDRPAASTATAAEATGQDLEDAETVSAA
jgi:hypothetical protein